MYECNLPEIGRITYYASLEPKHGCQIYVDEVTADVQCTSIRQIVCIYRNIPSTLGQVFRSHSRQFST